MKAEPKKIREWILGALFVLMLAGSFIKQDIYAVLSPFGTLAMFIVLGVTCVMLTMENREAFLKKDYVTVLSIIGAVVAPVCLFIIHSGMGAVLVVYDMILSCFLVIRGMSLSDKAKRIFSFIGAAFMLFWFPVVRWDYGFNMVGLVFLILLIFAEILLEYVKNDLELEYLKYVQILYFFTSILLPVCYQARSAALSVIFFGVAWLLVPVIIKNRVLYNIWIGLLTVGSLLFTGLYAIIGMTGWNVRFLYKDVLSGRELIWGELWKEFMKRSLTGIGSSYEMKSFFIFEVHNGLMDILVVHGLPVFLIILILLFTAFNRVYSRDLYFCPDKRLAFAGVSALLFASFFENCFIVTPYSMIFLVLMLILSPNVIKLSS